MEKWEEDFEWLRVQHFVKDVMKQSNLPDLNNVLLAIGLREYGHLKGKYSKEEKRDLMNVAACVLLEMEGYYTFRGLDEEGWPHFDVVKNFDIKGADIQEEWLKSQIIKYFHTHVYEKISQDH